MPIPKILILLLLQFHHELCPQRLRDICCWLHCHIERPRRRKFHPLSVLNSPDVIELGFGVRDETRTGLFGPLQEFANFLTLCLDDRLLLESGNHVLLRDHSGVDLAYRVKRLWGA